MTATNICSNFVGFMSSPPLGEEGKTDGGLVMMYAMCRIVNS